MTDAGPPRKGRSGVTVRETLLPGSSRRSPDIYRSFTIGTAGYGILYRDCGIWDPVPESPDARASEKE